jgi:hypothetical protein
MKVFISYSDEDSALAKKVARVLRQNGLDVWIDDQVLPGDNWAQKASEALEESEAMVVLLSASALKTRWVKHDISFALGKREYSGRLIPVVVGSLEDLPADEYPWILRRLKIIEIHSPQEEEEGIEQIADVLREAS